MYKLQTAELHFTLGGVEITPFVCGVVWLGEQLSQLSRRNRREDGAAS